MTAGDMVALEPGDYRGFTGLIQWGGTEGWAEDADFGLTVADWSAEYCFLLGNWHSPKKTMMILWRSGTWIDGTWEGGEWASGTWKNGTWLNGTWHGGTWLDGTWKNGYWQNGWWHHGTWHASGMWADGWQLGTDGRFFHTKASPLIEKARRDYEECIKWNWNEFGIGQRRL